MIIDDGREIDNVEDVVFKVGGVYKCNDTGDYYILSKNEDNEYYYLINLYDGEMEYYDYPRNEMQDTLNDYFKYISINIFKMLN